METPLNVWNPGPSKPMAILEPWSTKPMEDVGDPGSTKPMAILEPGHSVVFFGGA